MLNYFSTTGDQVAGCGSFTDRDGNPITARNCDARGAWDAENLERQQDKIVAAINALDADIVALEEIENSAQFGKDRDAALAALTKALNADLGDTRHNGKHRARGPARRLGLRPRRRRNCRRWRMRTSSARPSSTRRTR